MSGRHGRWLSWVALTALWAGGQVAAAAAGAQPAVEASSAARPGGWPRDDVFASALAKSGVVPSPRFQALKLLSAAPADLLVLPVQMQAHGWSAAFSALIGAQLDRVLADRGVKANRQMDLFDLDGPFARRFSVADVQAFSERHGNLPVLAIFAGRDAEGSVLLTLEWRREGRVSIAHRTLPEERSVEDVLKSVAQAYPDMLAELGLAVRPAAAPQPRPCPAESWQLQAAGADRIQAACQALVMGALLPDFQMRARRVYPQVRSRAKLAALAHAYVEADLLEARSGTALRTVAWAELELDITRDRLEAHTSVDDPVARPLARLLWSRVRGEKLPVASRQSAEQAYLEPDAARLPAFARAAYRERAGFHDPWHRVDFCALEEQVAVFRASPGCEAAPGRRSGSAAELMLLTEWRFARHHREVEIEASLRSDRTGWERAWNQVPSAIAAHPFMRWLRFRSEPFDKALGGFDGVIQRVRSAAIDSTAALADVQRLEGRNVEEWALASGRWTTNQSFKSDADVVAASQSEQLLFSALTHEGFVFIGILPRKKAAEADMSWQARLGMTPQGPVWAPPGAVDRTSLIFMRGSPSGLGMSEYGLQERLRRDPQDMMARVGTAMLRWKAGASLADVRRFIDEHQEDRQADGAIGNSHDWAIAAHAFFFAGELDAARDYYQRAAKFNTGSESELIARQRLRLIDGDLRGALDAASRRVNRYESDFARRDAAGLSFILGKPQPAWALLAPRLSTSSELALWAAVDVGHRQDARSISEARQWAIDSGSGRARVGGRGMDEWMIQRLLVLDRQPADKEVVLARGQWREEDGGDAIAALASVELARSIWTDRPQAEVARLRSLLLRVSREQASKLAPLYIWTVHRANAAGSELALRNLQGVETTQPFDVLLAAAVLSGLERKRDESLALLGAARKELSSYGAPTVLNDELRSPPYLLGLMSHLLFRQTGEQSYREEALRLARAYQRIFPFLAWPHALVALSTNDSAERLRSACRAQVLDPRSRFLELAGAVARSRCPASLW